MPRAWLPIDRQLVAGSFDGFRALSVLRGTPRFLAVPELDLSGSATVARDEPMRSDLLFVDCPDAPRRSCRHDPFPLVPQFSVSNLASHAFMKPPGLHETLLPDDDREGNIAIKPELVIGALHQLSIGCALTLAWNEDFAGTRTHFVLWDAIARTFVARITHSSLDRVAMDAHVPFLDESRILIVQRSLASLGFVEHEVRREITDDTFRFNSISVAELLKPNGNRRSGVKLTCNPEVPERIQQAIADQIEAGRRDAEDAVQAAAESAPHPCRCVSVLHGCTCGGI